MLWRSVSLHGETYERICNCNVEYKVGVVIIPVRVCVKVIKSVTAPDLVGTFDFDAVTEAVSDGVVMDEASGVPVCVYVDAVVARSVGEGVVVTRLSVDVGEAVSEAVALLVGVSVCEGVDEPVLVADLDCEPVRETEGETVLLGINVDCGVCVRVCVALQIKQVNILCRHVRLSFFG
jgi:hypothetical protein